MSLKGLRHRSDDLSDVESEREALRRQRAEAAAELETLKRTLAERVARVQDHERELAVALARVEKREQKLAAAETKQSRLASARLRLAEAKEARTVKLPPVDAAVDGAAAEAERLTAAAQALAQRETDLVERELGLDDRAEAQNAREAELDAREATLSARVEAPTRPEPESEPEPSAAAAAAELEQIEAKLAELHEAERAFARTQAELATRSDALAVREELVAAREQAVAAADSPTGTDLEALEARIRRLERQGLVAEEPQTFSAGLRALQERGLRTGPIPDEPLH